jgi:LPS-assembly protein
MNRHLLSILFFLTSALCSLSPATALEEEPLLIKADEVTYDEQTDIVTASGNVEISQKDRILRADIVTYQRQKDLLTASGHVWTKEPDGEIIFSDYMEFSNETKDGFIQDAKVLLTDNTRVAAKTGRKYGREKMIFTQAVYSPCNVCKSNPEKPPLWQIKSGKVIHYAKDQVIVHHNARMEIFGFPVLFSPYFRHPDPTVKRKSGVLMPTYGSTGDLGAMVSLPVYYVIAPNKDIIITPILTSKEGPIIATQYRHRAQTGDFSLSGSFTRTKQLRKPGTPEADFPHKTRWHVFSAGRFDLNEDHLLTFDINRASDTTYLRRYPVSPQGFKLLPQIKNLTSVAAVEQFKPYNYASLKGFAFQTDAPRTTPLVFPLAHYTYQSDPGKLGETWEGIANIAVIGRRHDNPGLSARNFKRLSLEGAWQVPYITRNGHHFKTRLSLRIDDYLINGFQPTLENPRRQSYNKLRTYPLASLEWRYPLIRSTNFGSWLVEPAAMLVSSKSGGNSYLIPNEDSQSIQLDESNLFLPNRFSNFDLIDTGHRVVYGFSNIFYLPENRKLSLFIGQSRRLDHRRLFTSREGEDQVASDYIGKINLIPSSWATLQNRFSIMRKHLQTRFSETTLTLGKPVLSFNLGHTYVSKIATLSNQKISQASWGISSAPSENWILAFSEVRNLASSEKQILSRTLDVTYHNECIKVITKLFKNSYTDRDIKPNSGVLVQIVFKNLGSFNPISAFGLPTNSLNFL